MGKHTHLIERCSSFLRTGVAWRLKIHGYSFSEAYWRLREKKGLQSSYDKKSLEIWSSIITSLRRGTSPLKPLSSTDKAELKSKRDEILFKMEEYRNKLEMGSLPHYLYDGTSYVVVEHILSCIIGDVRLLNTEQQLQLWQSLDYDKVKNNAIIFQNEIDEYTKFYNSVLREKKDLIPTPEEWASNRFNKRFIKDKVWQIRTGQDIRSSVNAGIGQKLNFIWDIPTLTDAKHREIYLVNQSILNSYKEWKQENQTNNIEYSVILEKIHSVLDSVKVPNFK